METCTKANLARTLAAIALAESTPQKPGTPGMLLAELAELLRDTTYFEGPCTAQEALEWNIRDSWENVKGCKFGVNVYADCDDVDDESTDWAYWELGDDTTWCTLEMVVEAFETESCREVPEWWDSGWTQYDVSPDPGTFGSGYETRQMLVDNAQG